MNGSISFPETRKSWVCGDGNRILAVVDGIVDFCTDSDLELAASITSKLKSLKQSPAVINL